MRRLLLPLVLLAGCSQSAIGADEAADGRDPAAVVAALRPLDPCALIKGDRRLGPHRCAAAGRYDGETLRVDIGVWDDPATPGAGEVLDLDGARALRRDFDESCVLDLPVGADLVIRFTYAVDTGRASDYACTVVTDTARAAVASLAAPVETPGPHLDACTVLNRAEPDGLADLTLRFAEVQHGLDLCQARADVDGGWATRYSVHLLHGTLPTASNERMDTLDSRPVAILQTGDDCEYSWSGPSELIIRVKAPTCDTAASLASKLIPIATDPAEPVDPQRPITLPAG